MLNNYLKLLVISSLVVLLTGCEDQLKTLIITAGNFYLAINYLVFFASLISKRYEVTFIASAGIIGGYMPAFFLDYIEIGIPFF